MKREAIGHRKMKKLCKRLNMPSWQAIGILESIWHLTAREAPQGDIGKLPDEDIGLGIDYDNDATELIEALVYAGWIDPCAKHRLVIHDWPEHATDTTKKYVQRNHLEWAIAVPTDIELSETVATSLDTAETCLDLSALPLPLPVPLPEPLPATAANPDFMDSPAIEPSPPPLGPQIIRKPASVAAASAPVVFSDGNTLEYRLDCIRQWLFEVVQGRWLLPDPDIVSRIHDAIRGAPIEQFESLLLQLQDQKKHVKADGWGFFLHATQAHFGRLKHASNSS